MTRGANIPIAADASGVIKGTKDTAAAIEKVIDTLEDVDQAGSETSRALDKALDGVQDSADDSAKKVEKSYREAFDDVKKAAKKAGDDVGDHLRKGASSASGGIEDLRKNTAQNAKEMGASFQDVGSAIDGLQGLAAEALEGFGPAGVAAGVAMAAGIGIAQQALQRVADRVNEVKEQAGELALAWRDASSAEQVAAIAQQWDELGQKIVDAKSWWEVWQDDARNVTDVLSAALAQDAPRVKAFMDAFSLADPIARQKALAGALADATDEAHRLDAQVTALTAKQQRAGAAARYGAQATEAWSDADALALAQAKQHRAALDDLIPTMQEQAAQADATARQIEALARVEGLTVEQYRAKALEAQRAAAAQDAQRQAAETYAAAVAGMADAQDVYSAATERNRDAIQAWADQHKMSFEEAQKAWTDAPTILDSVLDELSARVQKRRDFEANLADLAYRGFGALADELRAQGPEAGAAMADLLAQGTDAQVQQYATDQGSLLGKSLAQGAASSVASSGYLINGALRDVEHNLGPLTVPVKVDTTDAERFFRTWRPEVQVVARAGKPAVT